MKEAYFPQEIEKKWQKKWEESGAFKTRDDVDKIWGMSETIQLPM